MEKEDFIQKLATRTSEPTAQRIADALKEDLIEKLHFMKDGLSSSVFEIENSNLVFKVFDRRHEKNPRITHSRFTPHARYETEIEDSSGQAQMQKASSGVIITLEPQLTHEGVTPLHQEMLRYHLWTQEGLDFWDHIPAAGNPKEVKNVMLDYRGVPYQVDKDAVRLFDDRYNEYPADGHGKRSDAQYLDYRANSWSYDGRSDTISDDRFAKIKAACAQCDWPVNQNTVFDKVIDQQALQQFSAALQSLEPARLISKRS